MSVSNAIRSPSASSAPGHRLELVDGEHRAQLLELLRGAGVGLHRLLDERLEVDVEQPDPVLVDVFDRVLVLLVVGERVAVVGPHGALELRLGADREEVADEAGGHAVLVHLVVDALVRALLDRAALVLDALVDRLLRLVGVLRRDQRDVAGLVAVDAGDPHARLLAQPRRDVLLVAGAGVRGLLERLVDQLVDLGLRIVRAQDLAGGVQHVVALVALGAHDALEVDGGAGRDGLRRVGVPASGGAAARGQERGDQEEAGEGQQAESGHRTRVRTAPADCNSGCSPSVCTPSCARDAVGVLTPPTAGTRIFAGKTGPQADRAQGLWDE